MTPPPPPRTLLVGGVSSLHDALLAAALRGRGLPAEAIPVPDEAALHRGRALLSRGHCNPTYYLAGALVRRLERERDAGAPPDTLVDRFAHLTLGSCGPCRFATYAAEYRRALSAAGFGGLPVLVIDQLRPEATAALSAMGVRLDAPLLASLARAVVTGDVLVRAGCEARGNGSAPHLVDQAILEATGSAVTLLAAGRTPRPALVELSSALRGLDRSAPPSDPVRVRITGEFFAGHTDGDGGYGLVRLLERQGARVEAPAVTDWLSYLAWQVEDDVARRAGLHAPDGGPRGLLGRDAAALARKARAVGRGLRLLYHRYATAASVRAPLLDMDELATLAGPHYRTDVRAGMGHLEVGTFLAADRRRSADLVVSIKPFGCLPSSAISDGVMPFVARHAEHTCFLPIETSGDNQALVESRLELALERAREAATRRRGTLPVDQPPLHRRHQPR